MSTKGKYEPVFLDHRGRLFIESWPNVPENLRPAYSRFYDAGCVWVDPNIDTTFETERWPGALRLTTLGESLRDAVQSQSFNFFHFNWTFDRLPLDDLVTRKDYAGFYLALFKLTWNDPDVRRYIDQRMKTGPAEAVFAGQDGPQSLPVVTKHLGDLSVALERQKYARARHTKLLP